MKRMWLLAVLQITVAAALRVAGMAEVSALALSLGLWMLAWVERH